MASMGDDQEENIEMWKIKKVYAHTHIYIYFVLFDLLFYARVFSYFFSLVCVFVCAGAMMMREKAPRRGKDERWLFLLCRAWPLLLSARALTPRARYAAFE